MNNTTNSSMLPGLTIFGSPSFGTDITVIAPGNNGSTLTNYSVFDSYNGGESLNFLFSPGVTAASLGVVSEFSAASVAVNVYSPSLTLLGSDTVTGATTGVGNFIGVTATAGQVIGTISITAPSGIFVGADQVQFGQVGQSFAVPEPSTLVLAGLSAILCMGYAFRRRRVAARSDRPDPPTAIE